MERCGSYMNELLALGGDGVGEGGVTGRGIEGLDHGSLHDDLLRFVSRVVQMLQIGDWFVLRIT
jgi:hypothetical protein